MHKERVKRVDNVTSESRHTSIMEQRFRNAFYDPCTMFPKRPFQYFLKAKARNVDYLDFGRLNLTKWSCVANAKGYGDMCMGI